MNKVTQKYQVVDNAYGSVVAEYRTREPARNAYASLGGASNGYTLKQITTVVVEQKIR